MTAGLAFLTSRKIVGSLFLAFGMYMPDKLLPPVQNREAISTQRLSRLDLQRAMTDVKRFVEARFESDLNLVKVSAQCVLVAAI